MSPKFQVYKDSAEKIRFRILANNNQVVAFGTACEDHEGCLKAIADVQRNCNVAFEDLTVEDCPVIPNPKFEVYTDQTGLFRFRLKDANGVTLVQGEGYGSKEGCLGGLEIVKSCFNAAVEDPFATEVVINVEIPKVPAVTITSAQIVAPAPAAEPIPTPAPTSEPAPIISAPSPSVVTIHIGPEPSKQSLPVDALPVISMITMLGFEVAAGLASGVLKAMHSASEAAQKTAAANIA